jgi:hypothetical protein
MVKDEQGKLVMINDLAPSKIGFRGYLEIEGNGLKDEKEFERVN